MDKAMVEVLKRYADVYKKYRIQAYTNNYDLDYIVKTAVLDKISMYKHSEDPVACIEMDIEDTALAMDRFGN